MKLSLASESHACLVLFPALPFWGVVRRRLGKYLFSSANFSMMPSQTATIFASSGIVGRFEWVLPVFIEHFGSYDPIVRAENGGFHAKVGVLHAMNGDLHGVNGHLHGVNRVLHSVNGDLRGVNGDLHGVNGHLQAVNGVLHAVNGGRRGVSGDLCRVNGLSRGMNRVGCRLNEFSRPFHGLRIQDGA